MEAKRLTLIPIAAKLGRFETLKELIESNKENINQVDDYGDAALHHAVAIGRLDIVQYLLSHGANVNMKNLVGSTPLHKLALATTSAVEIAKLLSQHNADINIKNDSGFLAEDLVEEDAVHDAILGPLAVTVKLNIPKENYGRVIGKGGVRVKELREETKTRITIPSPKSSSSEIVIHGRQEGVDVARRRILQWASSKEMFEDDEQRFPANSKVQYASTKIRMPKAKHKYLIGKGGKKLQEIIGDTDAQVFIPPNNDPSEEILVQGPFEHINQVVKRIYEAVQQPSKGRSSKPREGRGSTHSNGNNSTRPVNTSSQHASYNAFIGITISDTTTINVRSSRQPKKEPEQHIPTEDKPIFTDDDPVLTQVKPKDPTQQPFSNKSFLDAIKAAPAPAPKQQQRPKPESTKASSSTPKDKKQRNKESQEE